MTDKPEVTESDVEQTPSNPARRRLLGGIAMAGAALSLGGCQADDAPRSGKPAPSVAALNAQLGEHIHTVVVLYAENRSFNNLFAGFPGLQQPLKAPDSPEYRQRDRDGSMLTELPRFWGGLAPHAQTVDGQHFQIGEDAISGLPNQPFALSTADGTALPHGVITASPLHRFYENQLQINGGNNDGFAAWGSTGGLVMGHYADSATNLRLWGLARQYTLCDNFFMGAFGGSFLNHQYLAAAQPPFYPNAEQGPAKFQIASLEGNDPTGIHPKPADTSPASAMQGQPKWASRDALTPDFWAVNTLGPAYAPAFNSDPKHPELADLNSPNTLPAQSHLTIGDVLSQGGVDWAWYAGGWQLALENIKDRGVKSIGLIVSDNLTGLDKAIPKVYNTPHQKCIVHFTRNVLVQVHHKHKQAVADDLKKVFDLNIYDDTCSKLQNRMEAFCSSWEKVYPALIKKLKATDLCYHTTYLNYDFRIRRMIYTTNWIERLNRDYRRVLKIRGAMPSIESVLALLSKVSIDRENNLYKFPINNFKFEPKLKQIKSGEKS